MMEMFKLTAKNLHDRLQLQLNSKKSYLAIFSRQLGSMTLSSNPWRIPLKNAYMFHGE